MQRTFSFGNFKQKNYKCDSEMDTEVLLFGKGYMDIPLVLLFFISWVSLICRTEPTTLANTLPVVLLSEW